MPLQEHTKHVEYLHENEMVVITRAGYVVSSLDMESPKARDPSIVKLELSLEAIEKGGYKHFMLKVSCTPALPISFYAAIR